MRIPTRWFLFAAILATTVPALAQIRVSITVAPPPLPVYEQPLLPGDGYIWMPGYWGWDEIAGGYYWVPGTWVLPPEAGLLWTPGYWTWRDTAFVFVEGYWGPVVGFYGGIDYGFGYPGHGYYGGRWTGGHFSYNRAVNNVNVTVVHNTYVENVTVGRTTKRVSYNGGKGGIVSRPTARETEARNERHVRETQVQMQHVQHARSMPELHAKANNGKPPILATARPEIETSRDRGPGAPRADFGNERRSNPEAARRSPALDQRRSQTRPSPRPSTNTGIRPPPDNVSRGRGESQERRASGVRPEEAQGRSRSSEARSKRLKGKQGNSANERD